MTRRGLALLGLLPLLGGCSSDMSALSPGGPVASRIADLFWMFFALACVVWVLVMLALAYALLRRRRAVAALPVDDPPGESGARGVIYVLIALTAVIVSALSILSFLTGRSLASLGGSDPIEIEIVGQQWWWKVTYTSPAPSLTLTSANDIHVPAGRPVRLVLKSRDVIHSFWIPEIAGKRDLIPGQTNALDIMVSSPGEYRGQCAEFCGFQHAHMRLVLIAQKPEEFDAWYSAQLKPAPPPQSEAAKQGQQAFLTKGCVMCHQISGTPAKGQIGPDLTHVASRTGIAANTLPMTRGALAAWVADPQSIKPGTKMPRVDLTADELNFIVDYLEQLK